MPTANQSPRLQIAPSFTEQALAFIKEQILSGEIKPGERLNEVELAQYLGISRTPIREAIQRCANEGIVVLIPNRGAHVAMYSEGEIRNLFEVREALEVMATRLAGERANGDDIDALASLLTSTRSELDGEKAYPPDYDFHATLARLSRNDKLIDLLAGLTEQIRLARSLSGSFPQRAGDALQEHVEVFEAMRAGEPERAAELMRRHIQNSLESTLAILGSSRESQSE